MSESRFTLMMSLIGQSVDPISARPPDVHPARWLGMIKAYESYLDYIQDEEDHIELTFGA